VDISGVGRDPFLEHEAHLLGERIAHPREELLRSFAIPCAGTEELRDLIVDRTRGGGPTLEVNERGVVLNDLRETRSRGIAVPELRSEEHTSELQSRFDLVC